MVKIITFLIKTIRILRADIYTFVSVAKNIALTNHVVGRLHHCYFCELVWVKHDIAMPLLSCGVCPYNVGRYT